jgi:prolyl-tRNA synthetase
MFDAYVRIFDRMGLTYRAVAADTGAIGGSASHEFQVIADTGEDAIAWCPESGLCGQRRAGRGPAAARGARARQPGAGKDAHARARRAVKDVGAAAGRAAHPDGQVAGAGHRRRSTRRAPAQAVTVWLLLVRGDHALNEIKASKVPGLKGFRFATEAEIVRHFGCQPGYLGPINTEEAGQGIADRTVAQMVISSAAPTCRTTT